jgi:hypothetical protein
MYIFSQHVLLLNDARILDHGGNVGMWVYLLLQRAFATACVGSNSRRLFGQVDRYVCRRPIDLMFGGSLGTA